MNNLSGATTAVFIVSLSAALEVPVTVAWKTKDGTAKAGVDYEAASGSVTFEAGETTKQIQVAVYGRAEGDTETRTFSIELYPPENAILDQTLTEVKIQVTDTDGLAVTSLVVATGPRGLKGDPGLSAYQLAKLQGYEGTLEQWLQEQTAAGDAAERAEAAADSVDQKITDATATVVQQTTDLKDQAAQSASSAHASAEIAQSAVPAYKDAAAAQAAVTAGTETKEYFYVQSTGNVWVERYRNVSGVATATGDRLPNMDFVQSVMNRISAYFIEDAPGGYSLIFKDDNSSFSVAIDDAGRLLAGIARLGKLEIDMLNPTSGYVMPDGTQVVATGLPGFKVAYFDEKGYVAVGLKNDGTWAAGKIEANNANIGKLTVKTIKSPSFLRYFKTDVPYRLPQISHKIGFGQSLMAGVNTMRILTNDPLYNALRFVGGVRAQDGAGTSEENHASLVPYIETYKNTANGQAWETPMGGAIRGWYELSDQEQYNFTVSDLQILGSVPAEGSQLISTLSADPGTYMQRVYDDIQYGYDRAQELGKSYGLTAFYWMQGEADQSNGTTKETYKTRYNAMIDKINAKASSVTGSTVKVKNFVYQLSSWINRTPNNTYPTIPMALYELARENEDTILSHPMYIFDYTDHAHLTAESSMISGLYFAIAEMRTLIDGKKFEPLWPVDHAVQGRCIDIYFNPFGRLVLDTSLVSNPGNYGFSLVKPDGSSYTITSVNVSQNRASVAASEAILPGSILRYAFIGGTPGQSPGRLNGPRGCLRDSQGDLISFVVNGNVRRMDNYGVSFEIIL